MGNKICCQCAKLKKSCFIRMSSNRKTSIITLGGRHSSQSPSPAVKSTGNLKSNQVYSDLCHVTTTVTVYVYDMKRNAIQFHNKIF